MNHPEPNISSPTLSDPLIRNRRWTLLFVGEHGKVKSLKCFKGLVMAGAVLLFLACGAAAGMFFLYRNVLLENNGLQEKLEASHQQLLALRDDKDILMARLVLMTSKPGPDAAAGDRSLRHDDLKAAASGEPDPIGVSAPHDSGKSVLTEAHAFSAGMQAAERVTPARIAVEDLSVFHDPDSSGLRVEYKVRNTGSRSEPISGYCFVIISGDKDHPHQRLVIPAADLSAGKPSPIEAGAYFSIANYITLRLQTSQPAAYQDYHCAKVLVFAKTGKLLFEKDFTINPTS